MVEAAVVLQYSAGMHRHIETEGININYHLCTSASLRIIGLFLNTLDFVMTSLQNFVVPTAASLCDNPVYILKEKSCLC